MGKRRNSARLKQGRDPRGQLQRMHDREAVAKEARQGPTDEQRGHGEFVRIKAGHHRRVPVIETMHARSQLNDREYRSLAHYRDQAALAERSPTKSCLDMAQRGGGDTALSAAVVSALLETARIERDLGSLRELAHAVAIDDKSIAQWCIERFGGRERYDGRGKFVAIVPVGEKKRVGMATMELRMAAHRIVCF